VTALSSLFRPWEKHFTVVMWDQRCAGKTFARNGADSCKGMSIESVAREGNQVAQFLRDHLRRKKIIVLGHSWGTMIGLRMIKERPDLYSAYVGTGQVVSIAEKEPVIYADALKRVRAAHDEAGVKALQAIGPPPYKSFHDIVVERDWSERYDIPPERDLRSNMTPVVLFAPGWSLWDTYQTFERAADHAEAATFDANQTYDARKLGPDFAVPIYVINGDHDTITPAPLARRWFDHIRAPDKDFVVLKGGGHSAVLTMPDAFLDALRQHLKPGASSHG
jgi:pimeloyl-ACP methyl ester carboxylesterase